MTCMAILLAGLAGGCGGADSSDASDMADAGGASTDDPVFLAVVDNETWGVVDADVDPWPAPEDGAVRCTVDDTSVEPATSSDEQAWYEINTTNCRFATARTALQSDIRAGDTVRLRIWHYTMRVADGDFDIVVALGDPPEPVLEATIPAPNTEGGLLFDEWTAEEDVPAGTPIWWRIANHGANAWDFVEICRRRAGHDGEDWPLACPL